MQHRKAEQRAVIAVWRIGWQLTALAINSGSLIKIRHSLLAKIICDSNINKNTYATKVYYPCPLNSRRIT
jgi:hypothetical protein